MVNGNKERVLIIRVTHGLANAFRSMASAVIIAKQTDRRLLVMRHESKYSYSVTDFFDWDTIGARVVNEDELPDIDVYFMEFPRVIDMIRHSHKVVHLTRLNYYISDILPITNCIEDVIYIETSSSIGSKNHADNYIETMRHYYRSLPLLPSILQSFHTHVRNTLPVGDFTGIHIRRDDLDRYKLCSENYTLDKYVFQTQLSGDRPRVLCTDDDDVRRELGSDGYICINTPTTFHEGGALFDFLTLSFNSFDWREHS